MDLEADGADYETAQASSRTSKALSVGDDAKAEYKAMEVPMSSTIPNGNGKGDSLLSSYVQRRNSRPADLCPRDSTGVDLSKTVKALGDIQRLRRERYKFNNLQLSQQRQRQLVFVEFHLHRYIPSAVSVRFIFHPIQQ